MAVCGSRLACASARGNRIVGSLGTSSPRWGRPLGALFVLGVAGVLAVLVSGAARVAASPLPPKTPNADAYVDASQPNKKFGTSATLRVDSSPLQRSFLRFDLTD